MKKVLLLITILSIFLSFVILPRVDLFAQVSACPETMPIEERYSCLQKEREKLENTQGTLQKKLKNEDYQQLSLAEKISYINGQVSETERVINTLHMEILTQDLEISMLSSSIQEMEDKLGIIKQEVSLLEETVNQRVMESYKYSYVGALEVILDIKNIENVLRKTKYLIETRAKDKISLKNYSERVKTLEDDEKILAEKKAELQIKRNNIEEEKKKLVDEKNNLASQRAEQSRLLAESQRREQQYKAQLDTLSKIILETDRVISDVAFKLFQDGKLGNGAPVIGGVSHIGRQGHTGCSYGSHLHLEIREANGTRLNPESFFTVNGRYLSSGFYTAPYSGAYITQPYSSHGYAIDMVTFAEGNQDGSTYTVKTGICSAADRYIGLYGNQAGLRGEGAYLKAASSGRVYYGVYQTNDPSNPSKYALIKHNDGRISFYLHLQ